MTFFVEVIGLVVWFGGCGWRFTVWPLGLWLHMLVLFGWFMFLLSVVSAAG